MIYFILFAILLILELAYFRIARSLNIKDRPNERSSHRHVTLLGGGVVFLFAVLLYALVYGTQYSWLVAGTTLLAVVSFMDDLSPLSPKFRLFIHLGSLLLIFPDLEMYSFSIPLILSVLVIAAGVLNAYNFMDGINGMMGMTTLVVLGGLIYVNAVIVPFVDANLLYLLLMAVGIFNFFNFRKQAVCFAGDVGAFTMGIIMVFLILKLIIVSGNIVWIAMLAMFGVDTILTIVHRIFLGENITRPHRKHLFQILANELKISQLFISGGYALIQLIIIVGLINSGHYSFVFASVSILTLTLLYIFIKRKYFHLHIENTTV
jgi:UDP-N-acetylmuramyl pentapeptide phosphotransferase/UDP-N-acetylglucosamine-1-phosphate transferase